MSDRSVPRGRALRLGSAVAACALLSALAGCAPHDTAPAAASPRRIVVMGPAAGEMLDALGATDRIVGVGDFVTTPALRGLPRVGGYDQPSAERVLELEADLLVTTDSRAADPAHRRLQALGVRVLALDTGTYDGVFASLLEVGRVLGEEKRAGDVARGMRDRLDRIRSRAAGAPARRVLFVVGRDPFFVAGPGSHVDAMLEHLGATNVAHDAGSSYAQLSMETVLERLPEVIVDASSNHPGAPCGRLREGWAQWDFLPAVRDDRVFHVHPSHLLTPGVRLPEMTLLLGRIVRPEIFGPVSDAELGPTPGEAEGAP